MTTPSPTQPDASVCIFPTFSFPLLSDGVPGVSKILDRNGDEGRLELVDASVFLFGEEEPRIFKHQQNSFTLTNTS